jgi:hypothetical protein
MAAKVFGIESSSFSGLTISGAIIEGGELSREQGDLRKLTGNPCTTIADTQTPWICLVLRSQEQLRLKIPWLSLLLDC